MGRRGLRPEDSRSRVSLKLPAALLWSPVLVYVGEAAIVVGHAALWSGIRICRVWGTRRHLLDDGLLTHADCGTGDGSP